LTLLRENLTCPWLKRCGKAPLDGSRKRQGWCEAAPPSLATVRGS